VRGASFGERALPGLNALGEVATQRSTATGDSDKRHLVSYATADRERAKVLAEALQRRVRFRDSQWSDQLA